MKMLTVVIQPKKLDSVREGLSEIGVTGITATEVKGFGRQKGQTEFYRGSEFVVEFLPKVKLEIAIIDDLVEQAIETIVAKCKVDGRKIGNGKIFVLNLEQVIRISTGETGPEAV